MKPQVLTRRDFIKTAGLGAAALALMNTPGCSSQGSNPPNIVLFFADDMGYGDIGCFGHPTISTPSLDRLAREGIRLTSFYAASSGCSPSRAALLTGRYPLRCGVPNVFGPDTESGLPKSEVTIAEILKSRGYRTMAVGKWHLGHSSRELMPTSRGFDSYFGLLYSNDMIKPWVQTEQPLELYQDRTPIEHPVDQATLTKRYTEQGVHFIRKSKKSPFFLYMPYSMVHLPIHASKDFRGKSRAGLYGDAVEEMDWSVGRILQTLKQEGREKDTIVIFTSDNGPWSNMPPRMLQEGIEYWHAGTSGLLNGAKATSYEGGHRVPGIVRWPGKIPQGRVTAEPANTMDLFTTLILATGAAVPADRVIDGKNILPLLKGETASPSNTFFYERGRWCEAVRQGPWKYRLAHKPGDGGGRGQAVPVSKAELFNLELDPGERYNVFNRHPEIADRLLELLRAHAAEVGGKMWDNPG